jgi:hypothetical protein
MIRPDDFNITISDTGGSKFVDVVHVPTGNKRRKDGVAAGDVGRARDSLLAELRSLLFSPDDIRCDTGRSDRGDFIAVRHVPTGIHRTALRRDSSHELLLDEVLTELWADRIGTQRGGE